MTKKIFLVISILIVVFLGRSFFQEYLALHPYYAKIAGDITNWKVFGRGVVFAFLPVLYVMYSKKKSFWGVIASIFGGLFLFSLSYVSIKADLFGGGMKLFFNVLFLFALGLYMLVGFTALGSWIKDNILHLHTKKTREVFLDMGLGLIIFLLVVYILLFANILYTGVSRLIFLGFAGMMYIQRDVLKERWKLIEDALEIFTIDRRTETGAGFWSMQGLLKIVAIVLLVASLWYFYNGFELAYLPYPTAWDANHAYMFYPKMRAFHHGLYRNEASMVTAPHIRYMFITYFFSLFIPHGFMGISADTIAIQMNFLSGIFVLLFGLSLFSALFSFLKKISKIGHTAGAFTIRGFLFLGRFLLLQWLTSGMGAFLVFIDNKTDLGVLALIILALYSGFVFLGKVKSDEVLGEQAHDDAHIVLKERKSNIWKYIGLSGVFYAFAALAKPTAMFDVLNFALFLWSTWFSWVGLIGIAFLVIGVLTLMKFRGIKDYLPVSVGIFPAILGVIGFGSDAIMIFVKKSWTYLKYLLFWGGIFLVTVLIVKTPFILANSIAYKKEVHVGKFVESVLFGKVGGGVLDKVGGKKYGENIGKKKLTGLSISDRTPLYTQVGNTPLGATCTLRSQGFSSSEDLYKNTKKAPGSSYDEDVGRYVGYGWKGNPDTDGRRGIKPFVNSWWLSFLSPGCHSFNPLVRTEGENAKILCDQENDWKSLDVNTMQGVLDQLDAEQSGYTLLEDLITAVQSSGNALTPDQLIMTYGPEIRAVDKYMQDNTIKKIQDENGNNVVYIPYRYLNPFNNSFNRSLQNISSYYTDIGVVWIMLFIFLFVGLFYGIFKRKRALVGISLVTIFGWVMRWLIGGGILRYAIGIVIWTILSFVVYCYYLLGSSKNDEIERTFGIIFVLVFLVFGGYQLGLNMLRISSQGGDGAFMWYKTNHGIKETYNEKFEREALPKGGFGADDVFNLQFAHYKKFLDLKNTGEDDDGALIAGTYARYFVKNQHYVVYDQFLTWLREQFSDDDVCNSYLRLKDKHIKYLVIDPNIGTVVQGAGNQSLFDRFFGRVDTTTDTLVEDGVITMLTKLYDAGYVKYISSNNLGAKYAFIMPESAFGGLTGNNLALMRARLSVARFFGGRSPENQLIQSLVQLAEQRVRDGNFVSDVADLMGLQIDEKKLLNLLNKEQLNGEEIKNLSLDERKALVQYLNIRSMMARAPEQTRKQIESIIINSVNSGNQIIVLEVADTL